ncbi:MAG: hypothetical protein MJE63_16255 [Proteobacteria bacterium]|nr:hypothetical protein [Pseudomonadota bacterium]
MDSSSLVDWLVPQGQESNKAYVAKTKFVFGVAICMTLIAALNALRQFSVGHTTNGTMILLAVFLMLVSFIVFKFWGSLAFLCNSVTALLYFLITFLTFSFGGLSSNVGSWFGLVVLLGIILTGKKYGLFWGILSVSTVVAFYVAELNGVKFEAQPIKITGFFIGCFILCLAILGLGIIYETTTTNS